MAEKQTISMDKWMFVASDRIAVSDRYLFFVSDGATIQYCTHADFVSRVVVTRNQFTETHGVLRAQPNDGSHAPEAVRDLFACADDHLLVVLRSGEIWNVTLRQRKAGARVLEQDEWDWSRVPGGVDRVFMTPNATVTTFESLKEVVAA